MAKLPGRPSKRVALFAIGGGLAVIIIAFLLVYFVIFPTSSPKPFRLTSSTAADTASTLSTTSPAARSTSATELTGNWTVASGGSQAGYRVREKLAFLPAQSDAVGRTSQITGGASFRESKGTVTITAASFDVAVNTLKSDRSMRDEKSTRSASKAVAIRRQHSRCQRRSTFRRARWKAKSRTCQ